ncbi:MAG: Gfo/Idh/MocA family oxidoreductase, partial [Planctomycetota bacterium]|nr:Gfo/Idh/MocA family oxidoreductase [Planctomycetota bacterium]
MSHHSITRRDFVKATGAAAAAAAFARPAFAEKEPKPIRAALIGCGGRGTGAADNCLRSAPGVHLVAMGDVFEDRLKGSRGWLAKNKHAGFRVTDETCFTGFDAYKRILDLPDIDLVLLTSPPGFRPGHFAAAVAAGKHAFLEKPIAVDP